MDTNEYEYVIRAPGSPPRRDRNSQPRRPGYNSPAGRQRSQGLRVIAEEISPSLAAVIDRRYMGLSVCHLSGGGAGWRPSQL
jgi:hypothetical protein